MQDKPYNFVPGVVIGERVFGSIRKEAIFRIGREAITRHYKRSTHSPESTTDIIREGGSNLFKILLEKYGLKSKEEDLKKDEEKIGERVVFVGKLERLAGNSQVAEVKPDEKSMRSYTITLTYNMTAGDIKSLLASYMLPEPADTKVQIGASSLKYNVGGVEFKVQVYTKGFLVHQEMRKEEEKRTRRRLELEEKNVRRRERTSIEDAMKKLIGGKKQS